MRTGRPRKFDVTLSETEQAQLTALANSRALAHSLVRRAQIVLRSAAGESNTAIAERFGVSVPLVSLWRSRYHKQGLAGLYDAPRSGRPRTHDDEAVAQLLHTVVQTKPKDATHWTVRDTAEQTGISKSSVHRYFALFGVEPHRARTFKISSDPFFVGDDANQNPKLPGYWVANLRAGFEQETKRWRFSEFARLDNLANRAYVGSVIVNETNSRFFEPAPGRTAYVMFNAALRN